MNLVRCMADPMECFSGAFLARIGAVAKAKSGCWKDVVLATFFFDCRRTFEEERFKLRQLQLKVVPCGNILKIMRERTTFFSFKAKRLVSLVAVCPYGLKNYENLGYRLTGSLAGSRPLPKHEHEPWKEPINGTAFVLEEQNSNAGSP